MVSSDLFLDACFSKRYLDLHPGIVKPINQRFQAQWGLALWEKGLIYSEGDEHQDDQLVRCLHGDKRTSFV